MGRKEERFIQRGYFLYPVDSLPIKRLQPQLSVDRRRGEKKMSSRKNKRTKQQKSGSVLMAVKNVQNEQGMLVRKKGRRGGAYLGWGWLRNNWRGKTKDNEKKMGGLK